MPQPEQDTPPSFEFERPSKTALKKQAHDQQALGVALAELTDGQLASLDMPESLRDAIEQFRRTRSHEGRRRQMQFVGKLMRTADTTALHDAVASLQLGRAHDALALHQAEHWRSELVADDDALTRWTAEHPQSDLQRLRALIRSARKDGELPPEQRHGRAWRELFQFIKPLVSPDTSDNSNE